MITPFKLRIDEYSQLLDYRFNWNPDQSENSCILEGDALHFKGFNFNSHFTPFLNPH